MKQPKLATTLQLIPPATLPHNYRKHHTQGACHVQCHVNDPGAINSNTGKGIEDNDGVIMKGATSLDGLYEQPLNLDDAGSGDENCYSTLDPMYSQLQAHIGVPKPGIEIQTSLPQNDDNDYSCLQYK